MTRNGRTFTPAKQRELAFLLHGFRTRPHFVAYQVKDLPSPAPVHRTLRVRPAAADLDGAQRGRPDPRRTLGDQMIFEGFRP